MQAGIRFADKPRVRGHNRTILAGYGRSHPLCGHSPAIKYIAVRIGLSDPVPVAGTSHSSRRHIADAIGALALVAAICGPLHGQEIVVPPPFDPRYFSDSLRSDSVAAPATSDSMIVETSLTALPEQPRDDTTWNKFLPPSRWRTAQQYRTTHLLAGPSWPMPPLLSIAGGDLADWLTFHPAYDVNDAVGVGQARFFTSWGVVDRQGGWDVDGRQTSWQRLTFPMTPQFDPAMLPSYGFTRTHFGDDAVLLRDTAWAPKPQFDFLFYQGDFSDTYSEGKFRAYTRRGFGIDLSGTFFSSVGRFLSDDRDKRILALETFGPLKKDLYWRARYSQFRDKSLILTPEPFDFMRPERDDLLWTGEAAVARIVDGAPRWQIGARAQSGNQRLDGSGYSTRNQDRRGEVFAETHVAGWDVRGVAGLDQLEIDSTDENRTYGGLSVSRMIVLNDHWEAAFQVSAGDRSDAPLQPGVIAALAPRRVGILPSIRLARRGSRHSLYDLHRPLTEYSLIDASQSGYLYSESGDRSLADEWSNSATVQWGLEEIVDTIGFGWTVAGHAAYIENYTHWQGRLDADTLLGTPVPHYRYRPMSEDARSLGASFGLQGRLVWKLHYLTHYSVKYVVNLDNEKLAGYHPHKGVAMLSLIAPKWKYGVDVRLNAAGLWWYGDRRIDPTGMHFASTCPVRLVLSAT